VVGVRWDRSYEVAAILRGWAAVGWGSYVPLLGSGGVGQFQLCEVSGGGGGTLSMVGGSASTLLNVSSFVSHTLLCIGDSVATLACPQPAFLFST
jgi:hypothetical protein